MRFLAGAGKTGQLELHGPNGSGSIGFGDGRVVAATMGEEDGETALGALLTIAEGEFEFASLSSAPPSNLSGEIDEVIARAREESDRLRDIRGVIPEDSLVFVLSERAATHTRIELTSDQWRTLLAINGARDVAGVAEVLKVPRRVSRARLAELIRSGTIDANPPPSARSLLPPLPQPGASAPPPSSERAPQTESEPEPWSAAAPERVAAPQPVEHAIVEPGPVVAEPPAHEAWSQPAVDDAATWSAPAAALAGVDDRLAALSRAPLWSAPPVAAPRAAAEPTMAELESTIIPATWPDPAPVGAIVAEPERRRGLFGFGAKKDEQSARTALPTIAATPTGKLAAFANALIDELNSGRYGKGRVEARITNLLLRVDEQADPLDRPVPVEGHRLSVLALDGGLLPEQQAVPYLSLLVSQIHADAERAFGRDKAKQAYRAARDQVLGKDPVLQSADLAGRLPKV